MFQILPISSYLLEETSLICGSQASGSKGIGSHRIAIHFFSRLSLLEPASSEVPIFLLGVLVILQLCVELSHALSDGHIFQSI